MDPSLHRLPGAYWRAWVVLVLVVSIEFAVVFWASSLIVIRTRAGTSEATAAAATFIVGMVLARAAVATGLGRRFSRTGLMVYSLVLVVVGIAGAWQATTVAIGAGALLVAGLGVGPLYPIGVAFSLSLVRSAPEGWRLARPRLGRGHPVCALHPGRRG
jgi:MFS family permease